MIEFTVKSFNQRIFSQILKSKPFSLFFTLFELIMYLNITAVKYTEYGMALCQKCFLLWAFINYIGIFSNLIWILHVFKHDKSSYIENIQGIG